MQKSLHHTVILTVTMALVLFGFISCIICARLYKETTVQSLQTAASISTAVGDTPQDVADILNRDSVHRIFISYTDPSGNVTFSSMPEGMAASEHFSVYTTGFNGGTISFYMAYPELFPGFSIMVWIAAGVIALIAILTFFITKKTSRRILKPINDLASQLEGMQLSNAQELETDCAELKPVVNTLKAKSHRVQVYVEEVEKTAEIRQDFRANVSHELKTPLTTIKGFGEMLENGLITKTADIKRYGGIICRESTRLLNLINDIIKIAEVDSMPAGLFEKVNFTECCKNAVDLLSVQAQKNNITIYFTGSKIIVDGIPSHLNELAVNLIDNAIKYNKPGGHVWVKLYRMTDYVILSVRDDGIGIPRSSLERIFERFYRVDKSRSRQSGGTGLGLAIVKHIASYHSGEVQVFSEENVGTEFVFKMKSQV